MGVQQSEPRRVGSRAVLRTPRINVDIHGLDDAGGDAVIHLRWPKLFATIIYARLWAGLHYHFAAIDSVRTAFADPYADSPTFLTRSRKGLSERISSHLGSRFSQTSQWERSRYAASSADRAASRSPIP